MKWENFKTAGVLARSTRATRQSSAPTVHQPDRDLGLAVSVVIPVYNAVKYLPILLDSLVAQDIDPELMEIIAIDDGSTDGSGAVLDEYAERHENIRVFHEPNSGWPGIPRNQGLAVAEGRYVFFCDADDILGPEAMRRLVNYGDKHRSDVVVPRMCSLNGRFVPDVFRTNQVDADLEKCFRTLSPCKLFRREFLRLEKISFPTEKVRLEDGMMVTKAYLTASRVSFRADYDFYFVRSRDDSGNITRSGLDPEGYAWSIGEVSRLIRLHDHDPDRADRVIVDLYRRKGLKIYGPQRWARYSSARKTAWIEAHHKHVLPHVPEGLDELLPVQSRPRSQALRVGTLEALAANARFEDKLDITPVAVEVVANPDGLYDVQIQLPGQLDDQTFNVALVERGTGRELVLQARTAALTATCDVTDSDLAFFAPESVIDVYTFLTIDGVPGYRARLHVDGAGETGYEHLPGVAENVSWYFTKRGNLSARRHSQSTA
ncbi:glycosyltransferase family 2 protein [Paraoerskovia marina]|uniref:glycosyltransferase family 2 protein n=1 Tax=Paraoerskovia marina TaxID=545619 RepID=UPI000694DBA5|nr:glycosyltransferase [Paraoerskovia marina]